MGKQKRGHFGLAFLFDALILRKYSVINLNMKISEELEKTGNWLFKHRGSFPFLIVPLLIIALRDSEYIEQHFGHFYQNVWEVSCILISLSGLVVRSLTLGWVPEGTSGRNTKGQLADSLNQDAAYSIMRHPLYFGNFLIIFGFFLFVQVWWLVVMYALLFFIFYEHIIFSEESFLERKFGANYRKWADRTPVFFPNFKKWKASSSSFSWRMVFKREYSTLFGIIAGFVFIKFFAELFGEGHFRLRPLWFIFLAAGFIFYVTLRILRKHTNWLHIPTRKN